MQLDFTDATGRYDEAGGERYSDNDLRYGMMWAAHHLAEGFTLEPMKGYDLRAFGEWCRAKIQKEAQMLKLAPTIEHQTQPTPLSCTTTSIAMALGIPVLDLVGLIDKDISIERGYAPEQFAVWLAERGIWMRPLALQAYGRGERFVNGTLYLVGVRSRNSIYTDHCVLLDTRPPRLEGEGYNERSGWKTYDPNTGREGKKTFEWVDEYYALDAHELRSRDHVSGAIGRRPEPEFVIGGPVA